MKIFRWLYFKSTFGRYIIYRSNKKYIDKMGINFIKKVVVVFLKVRVNLGDVIIELGLLGILGIIGF